jgi:hypothetical protein
MSKIAMTVALEFRVSVQVRWLPVQDPDQPEKTLPEAGAAVTVTTAPVA